MKISKKNLEKGAKKGAFSLLGAGAGYALGRNIPVPRKYQGGIPLALGLVLSTAQPKYSDVGAGMMASGGLMLVGDNLLTNEDGSKKDNTFSRFLPQLNGTEPVRSFDEMSYQPVAIQEAPVEWNMDVDDADLSGAYEDEEIENFNGVEEENLY